MCIRDSYVIASKCFTAMWGLLALCIALFGNLFENLIQIVNIIGSIFYGTILGIFLVAFYFKKVGANAVFVAAIITQLVVIVVYNLDVLPFLWLNVIGALGVILIANLIKGLNLDSKVEV